MHPHDRDPVAFTVLWSGADYDRFRRRYAAAPQTRVLLGGWNRQTRFSRSGVRSGDSVFPVRIAKKRLYVLARLTVADLSTDGVTETVDGILGSRIHFDLVVPPAMLHRWQFAGGRPVKFLVNGEVKRSNSFQGVYRLSASTATDLFGLILEHDAQTHLTGLD